MLKIHNLICAGRNKFLYLVFSLSITCFAIFIMAHSIIDILSFKNNSSKIKIVNTLPIFNLHENFNINFNSDNKNIKNKKFSPIIEENDLDYEDMAFNNKMHLFNSQIRTNEFNIIKGLNSKKSKFIISILPLIIQENKRIYDNREKILKIKDYLNEFKTLDRNKQKFLENLAFEYNVNIINKHKIDIVEELLEKVDVIPNSIVLAQAANESGWGTSRFAKEFNALFGEYTFDSNSGVVPIDRNNGDKHLIKFFPTVHESIISYFNNINTHLAYKSFRSKRKLLRKNNINLKPIILVKHLNLYAEDKNYVDIIESIIKVNKLIKLDNLKITTTKS